MAKGPVAIGPSVAGKPVGNPFKAAPGGKADFKGSGHDAKKFERMRHPKRPPAKPKASMTVSQALMKGMRKAK